MKKIIRYCRRILIFIYKINKYRYIKYYENLPINDNTIFLASHIGKNIGNNLEFVKYISSNVEYRKFKIYILANITHVRSFKKIFKNYKQVKIIRHYSAKYYKILATSKFLFNDITFGSEFIKKDGQIYCNTWHGTPLKAMGKSVVLHPFFSGDIQRDFCNCDYIILGNKLLEKAIIKDYMLENICSAKILKCGYPKNSIFFNNDAIISIKRKYKLLDKKVYAYMPTWRNDLNLFLTSFFAFLKEIDKKLTDNELLYVRVHPFIENRFSYRRIMFKLLHKLKHIKIFPKNEDVYTFLNIADVLITDYSSVFFDFACSRKKIVLYAEDLNDYINQRGVYVSLDKLPFPKVFNINDLLLEIRSPKKYNDKSFLQTYCGNESNNVAKQICDYVILNKHEKMEAYSIPNNKKENILIYAGSMYPNGLTAALKGTISNIDLTKRNYYISIRDNISTTYVPIFEFFRKNHNYFTISSYRANKTLLQRVQYSLCRKNIYPISSYLKKYQNRFHEEFLRCYGRANFNYSIQFNGYEDDPLLMYVNSGIKNAVYVHSNMLSEANMRHYQNLDLLKYVYEKANRIILINNSLVDPTLKIAPKANVKVLNNFLDTKNILKKSAQEVTFDRHTKSTVEIERLIDILDNRNYKKIITIGRFSPEKGHLRLIDAFKSLNRDDCFLIIIGGNESQNYFNKTIMKIKEENMEDRVFLIKNLSNPYPILKKCDYFVLSSFYEGLGLVMLEADLLGKPLISTDIPGPRDFLLKHNGTLVENSIDGIKKGITKLLNGEIKTLSIDYNKYNNQILKEFEKKLFDI